MVAITIHPDHTALDLRFFRDADKLHEDAAWEIANALSDDVAFRQEITALKRQLQTLEDEWRLNGLTKPDGSPCSNDSQRDAALRLKKNADRTYQAVLMRLDHQEISLARAGIDLRMAEERRSLARRRMDMAIATRLYHAREGERAG